MKEKPKLNDRLKNLRDVTVIKGRRLNQGVVSSATTKKQTQEEEEGRRT